MTNPEWRVPATETVLVDMDGVMADFEAPNNALVAACGVRPIVDRQDFYYADSYRDFPDVLETIYAENRRPGFFRNFPVVDDAVEGWQRIMEAGFVPRVCSSPIEDHPTVIDEKKAWLAEHFAPRFGSWVVDTAIFNRDKSGYDAIAMIDDRPTLRNIESARWRHIVFDQSYNRQVETDFRLHGWRDERLGTLLRAAQHTYMSS
jgi:5'-nucleotidase